MGLFTAYHKKSNEQLMILIQDGDHRAFSHIYDRFSGRLKGYFLKMLSGEEQAAEDAVHDVFTKIIQRPGLFDTTKFFDTWLFSVAANHVKNIYRKRAFELAYRSELEKQGVTLPTIVQKMDEQIALQRLDEALLQLDEDKRSTFLLRYQQELSIQEIAEIHQVPEGTVKSRLHTIRQLLTTQVNLEKTKEQ